MAIILGGTVVTFDPDLSVLDEGMVYVSDDGFIEAVQHRHAPPPQGYQKASRLDLDAFIYPGLIELHTHIAKNALPLWTPPRHTPYASNEEWLCEESYQEEVRIPADTLGLLAGKALLKYAEVKLLISGVTSVQGSLRISRPYDGWLLRHVEYEAGFPKPLVGYWHGVPTKEQLLEAKDWMASGRRFICHIAEGNSRKSLTDFLLLKDHETLTEKLIAIHALALEGFDFVNWAAAGGGTVVWSPLSNLWLYGTTTRVVEAGKNGLRLCLGADWSVSGSKNLLGELKVADFWNQRYLSGFFSDVELCQMAVSNPADALGWDNLVGRLVPGLQADLFLTVRRHKNPYRNLIQTREQDVCLVLIRGEPLYGNEEHILSLGIREADSIYIDGSPRLLRLRDHSKNDADLSWRQVVENLKAAAFNPTQSLKALELQAAQEKPFSLLPRSGSEKTLSTKCKSPLLNSLDTLTHDTLFFQTLSRSSLLKGLLNDLRNNYQPSLDTY